MFIVIKLNILFLFAHYTQMAQSSLLRVHNGVYSRVSVDIAHTPQPSDCSQFFARLESLLKETSYGFQRLSQSRGTIGDYQISLPPSWDISQCQPSRFSRVLSSSSQGPSSHSDFYISALNELEEPRAEQFGPCGSMGYRVNVPMPFLDFELLQDPQELKQRGQILLREWTNYIYGVFPEKGFMGDKLYPYNYTQGDDIRLNSGCPTNESVFCSSPNATYDPYIPTKQNLLCSGQSASQIMLNSEDLRNESGPIPQGNLPKDPSFSYVVKKSSRYSILLDRSSIMGIHNRWTNIKRAFYRFIQYLPVGTVLNIVTFGSESIMDLPSTILTDSNREGLHGRIPRKVLEDEAYGCVSCALNLSLNSFRNYVGETEPGNVLLLSGSPSQPYEMKDLLRIISDAPIRVFPIIYPGSAHPDVSAFSKYGKQYVVPEGFSDPLSYLSETLLDILREAEGIPIQKVHEAQHLRELEVSGTFTLEEELRHKMSVTLSIRDEERVEFFEITNPSGEKHLFSKFEDGMVVFNHPGRAEPGIWTYHAKLYPEISDELNAMSLDVVSQSSGLLESEPILLEVFSSVDLHGVDAYNDTVIIYARLTKGTMKPVLGASLIARVYGPDGDEPVELTMADNGLGYPDITGKDGIYSAYFTEFASVPGFYSVQVSANHNEGRAETPKNMKLSADGGGKESCCGSMIHYEETIPVSPFHRQAVGNGFYVKQGLSQNTDLTPPSRVLDLRVEEYIEDSLHLSLKWSAPGGDLNKGKASKYEIRCHTSPKVLQVSFAEKGILVHSSFIPKPLASGAQQSCEVGIPWPNEKFYYALVAFDESGNASPISNIALGYIYEAPTTLAVPFEEETTEGAAVKSNLPLMDNTGGDVYARSKNSQIYLICGIVGGVVFLLIVFMAVILLRSRVKKRSYDGDDKDTYQAYEPREVKDPGMGKQGSHLTDWFDSLPRSFVSNGAQEPDGSPLRRKSASSYRQKVLTNGSFLNLKETCTDEASNSSSSRPTTSTTDPDSNSEHSVFHQGPMHARGAPPGSSCPETQSATAETYRNEELFKGSQNYFSFRGAPSSSLSEYPSRQMSRKKRRTESVV